MIYLEHKWERLGLIKIFTRRDQKLHWPTLTCDLAGSTILRMAERQGMGTILCGCCCVEKDDVDGDEIDGKKGSYSWRWQPGSTLCS